MKKYPISLFITGVIMNMIFHNFVLFIFSILLMIGGIWYTPCLYIGTAVLALDVLLSVFEQNDIRNATLYSDNENFKPFQDAILSKDWRKNVMDIVESKIQENDVDEYE